MKRARRPPLTVRRSRHVVLYWRGNRLIAQNYATRAAVLARPIVCLVLDFCEEWRTATDIQRELPFLQVADANRLIRQLVAHSLLQSAGQPESPGERAMDALAPWNPEAGFFHTTTKDVRFWSRAETARHTRARAGGSPMPPPAKSYRGVPIVKLPRPSGADEFLRVACGRRTWRRFSRAPLEAEQLATVLGTSIGVQQWMRIDGEELPLKTSPSGGARHPIEAYVIVRRVRGIRAGLYHYDSRRHVLERIRRTPSTARIRAYLPNSGYFAGAAALVFFTAVFARQLWRYPYSRAYRAALIEAGHVAQTFCLAATALELAPFCLMALADSLIERDLGIDGVSESVLYAAGVGRRPAGVSWAPRPRGTLPVRANAALARRR